MDQTKIGEFLKELRKEKNLTQEQLAEQLNVSNRSVSRWETGRNMPDIGLLVEIAELYDVSIPEIIDGKRRSEKMNEEVKETALKLSDYAETINQKIKMKLFWMTIAAVIGMIVFVVIEASGLDTPGSIYERVASVGLGFDFGMLIVIAMYLSGILGMVALCVIVGGVFGCVIAAGLAVRAIWYIVGYPISRMLAGYNGKRM